MMLPFLMSLKGAAALVIMAVLIIMGWIMIRKITKIDV
jgi:hypothetical protein